MGQQTKSKGWMIQIYIAIYILRDKYLLTDLANCVDQVLDSLEQC
jgi:hypothetical protein